MNESIIPQSQLRLTRALYDEIQEDLSRPHAFAHERIGFLFARRGTGVNGAPLVLAVDYVPIAEEQYEVSREVTVGASLGVTAIRTIMQRIMNTGCGAWHVHRHEHWGRPRFSRVDQQSLPPLIQSFTYAAPTQLHGAVLLSHDYATATTWTAEQEQGIALASVSVVGYPLSIYRRV